ncbi:hypothetical protein SESBI_50622 [Sesbania bispinosa]|nr:hypothetical protein SESBI_50622 [Sesbania bispinosa]
MANEALIRCGVGIEVDVKSEAKAKEKDEEEDSCCRWWWCLCCGGDYCLATALLVSTNLLQI